MSQSKTAISPTRAEDFSEWYQQVVYASELAEHSPVRGCMVIKPWGYALWERIQSLLDAEFKQRGIQNIYCPLLIPVSFLEKEAEHVSGFAKECAVVTHHRLAVNEAGAMVPAAPLSEPYVIRPTSEAIMGHMFAKWVQSYRDLPLLVNQWANVMRWEMRPRLFLRTSEFLWQEGHTVHATEAEAKQMALAMIECYESVFDAWLAIPVLRGEKTRLERFAGAENTWTIEALMQDGKALQAGTSHFLGQYFSKAFDIAFANAQGERVLSWTTSWGVSTRMIGGLVMSHGDDDGLCLPPRIAPYQVVIIPVIHKPSDAERIHAYIALLQQEIAALSLWGEPVRVHVDTRPFAHSDKKWSWIKRGVPIRLDIGLRDVDQAKVYATRRDDQLSSGIAREDILAWITGTLLDMQVQLWQRAQARMQTQIHKITTAEDWAHALTQSHEGKAYLLPWDGDDADEQALQAAQLTIRCLLPCEHPWVQSSCGPGVLKGKLSTHWALIAKAY